MKVLLLYDYPPSPSGLATQGDLLYHGLLELGVEAHAAHFECALDKEWYYRWFKPDLVVGVGYWGFTPQIILHPQAFGMQPVPWLVADGFVANYHKILNSLPLILVTSKWVKGVYQRDGLQTDNMDVLPVGCNVDQFIPYPRDDPRVVAIRQVLGIEPDQIFILTVGGDGASKGSREVMEALAQISQQPGLPAWKYVCKVWPQLRTSRQNKLDLELAKQLGISKQVEFVTSRTPRELMPFLLSACDIYAAPSRLEGFGMIQVEAGACERPVVSIAAMALLETMVQGKTAYLAKVALENRIDEAVLGPESGFRSGHRVKFDPPRIADYRADTKELGQYLDKLMRDPGLRQRMGTAGRERAAENYDYRLVAKRFVALISDRLGIS
jgi:glycosyltransferase involved in cell wall biosynthesis